MLWLGIVVSDSILFGPKASLEIVGDASDKPAVEDAFVGKAAD